MIDGAGIVENLSWAEGYAVANFGRTTLVQSEDLKAYAAEALCVLAGKYRPGSGTFGGFVRTRLRFAMIDLLRRDFGGRTGRGLPFRSVTTVSLEQAVYVGSKTTSGGRYIHPDETSKVPDGFLVEGHEERVVDSVYARDVFAELDRSTPEGYVLAETGRGRLLSDVARDLGVTESRACQIRTKARKRLIAELAG